MQTMCCWFSVLPNAARDIVLVNTDRHKLLKDDVIIFSAVKKQKHCILHFSAEDGICTHV